MKKNKSITVASHLLIWFMLFCLPYLLSYGQQQDISRVVAHFWIPLLFSAIIFYSNHFIFVDKFLFPKKTLQFVSINILMIGLFLFFKEYIEDSFFKDLIKKATQNTNGAQPPLKMAVYLQLLSYMAPLLLSIALKNTERWNKAENERKEADNFKLKSELQHLHYQLQPHFFFNALNNIYSMVDYAPDQAKSSIHSLSKLMRYMLYETNLELVPLSKEIDFMKKYVDVMKLRVSSKTAVSCHFPTETSGILIAPLLFISLIENAFKHGVSASKESQITIEMTVKNNSIFFTITNTNFPKRTDDKSGSGIGIPNLEKRLALLYPNKHLFKTAVKDHYFSVELELQTT